MAYSCNYDWYVGDKMITKVRDESCFSQLFSGLYVKSLISGFVKIYSYYTSKEKRTHKLSFTKEEILYVFDKLKAIFDCPEIEDIDDGLSFSMKLENKTAVYIKLLCTIIRYFYETNREDDGECMSTIDIMRASIDYSKEHPEVPFIEILQLFHYDNDRRSIHSIVNHESGCYPVKIISEKTLSERLLNPNVTNIHSYSVENAVFGDFIFNHMSYKNSQEYINSFDKIERI